MTTAGFERLINLYVNDIASIKYDLDNVEQTETNFQTTILDNTLEVRITIPDNENGSFTNFRIITTTDVVSTERALSFEKTQEAALIKFPFIFVNG